MRESSTGTSDREGPHSAGTPGSGIPPSPRRWGPLSSRGADRPAPPLKVATASSCPAHCPERLARSLPPTGEPHGPPAPQRRLPSPPSHASQLPPGSRPGAAKLDRPRLAPGPRAHTKLGRPPRLASAGGSREAEGKEEKGEELGAWERRRGPAGASRPASARPRAQPEAGDAAPPPRSSAGPALGRRARTQAGKAVRGPFLPQSPALAGNNAARLPLCRPAQSTHEHPHPDSAGLGGGVPAPKGLPKPGREMSAPGEGGRTGRRGGSAAREERLLPGPRQPRPPDSYKPAQRANGRSRGARSSAWET